MKKDSLEMERDSKATVFFVGFLWLSCQAENFCNGSLNSSEQKTSIGATTF